MNDSRYPSVDEQAVEVSDTLRAELTDILEQIRREFGPGHAVLAYIDMIRSAKDIAHQMREKRSGHA